LGNYRASGEFPKGEFKKLLFGVIDFNKGTTILGNQCLA